MDNHYTNLRWDTRKGNHADLQKHGTALKGSRNGRAKLTEQQVRALRNEYNELKIEYGKRQVPALMKKYGLRSHSSFHAIIHRKHWTHVS